MGSNENENKSLYEIVRNKQEVFLDNPVEFGIWCEYLNCSEGDLMSAVKRVGYSVKSVKMFLAVFMV